MEMFRYCGFMKLCFSLLIFCVRAPPPPTPPNLLIWDSYFCQKNWHVSRTHQPAVSGCLMCLGCISVSQATLNCHLCKDQLSRVVCLSIKTAALISSVLLCGSEQIVRYRFSRLTWAIVEESCVCTHFWASGWCFLERYFKRPREIKLFI